mgnify:CR=1 FL=1
MSDAASRIRRVLANSTVGRWMTGPFAALLAVGKVGQKRVVPQPKPARLLGVREWVGYALDDIAEMVALLERAAPEAETQSTIAHKDRLMAYARDPFADRESAPSFVNMALDMWRYKMSVPQHARRAAMILVCSAVEGTLVRFGEWLQDEEQLSKHVTEFDGRGLPRIRDYAKSAGFPFPSKSPRWAELNDFMNVRNVLVHRLAIVKPGKEGARVREYARKRKTLLAIEDDGEVVLYDGLPAHAVEVANQFLSELAKACPPPPPLPPLKKPGLDASWLEILLYERLKKLRGE